MNPASKDVASLLESSASGLGYTYATDLFIGMEPTTPDSVVTVLDTGGEAPEHRYEYDRPTVQVRVRGARGKYQATWKLIKAIADYLKTINNTAEGDSTRYVQIWQQGDIFFLEYDETERPIFTVNFRIHRTTT